VPVPEPTPAKPAPAPATEDQRREVQRQIQQLVLRLRQEGKSEKEIKSAKEELKRSAPAPLAKPDGARARKKQAWKEWKESSDAQAAAAEETRKQKLEKVHDLVVIPVLWRGRHDKVDVLKAAEDIKALLVQQGLDVWVDSRRQYTPGQKFAHWEHRGVLLRVEVGPDDVKNGVCRVCLAKTPGEYKTVERKKVNLPPSGARSLLLALKEFGLSKIDIERRSGDSADEEEAEESAKAKNSGKRKAPATKEEAVDEELGGNWQPRMKTTPKGAAGGKKKGGKKK